MLKMNLGVVVLLCCSLCVAQTEPKPESATTAIARAFETYDIVMFGEVHANRQEYEWLQSLVGSPAFAARVDDIVVEFGNSLYQKSVDRYIRGDDLPVEQVQKAWRNTVGSFGPPSPVYGWLYHAVREANLKRNEKHKVRIVCADPYIDWEKVKDREDIGPFMAHREDWYTQVVKDEVIAKHHRALLIMGSGHFLRRNGPSGIEQELRKAGAHTFVVVFGTNTTGGEVPDPRFNSWIAPAMVATGEGWVADLPAVAVTSGGTGGAVPVGAPSPSSAAATAPPLLKLKDAADALLYLGPRDSLTQVSMARSELEGTPYGKELERRLTIELGRPINFLTEKEETPQFAATRPAGGATGPPRLPPPPKSIHDPLPPRPASQ